MLTLVCPACHQSMRVPDDTMGQSTACPRCKALLSPEALGSRPAQQTATLREIGRFVGRIVHRIMWLLTAFLAVVLLLIFLEMIKAAKSDIQVAARAGEFCVLLLSLYVIVRSIDKGLGG